MSASRGQVPWGWEEKLWQAGYGRTKVERLNQRIGRRIEVSYMSSSLGGFLGAPARGKRCGLESESNGGELESKAERTARKSWWNPRLSPRG